MTWLADEEILENIGVRGLGWRYVDGLLEAGLKEENLCITCLHPRRTSTIDEELNQVDR